MSLRTGRTGRRDDDDAAVVRNGQIIERGTHQELMVLNGLYSRLAQIQGTTFIEESFERLTES